MDAPTKGEDCRTLWRYVAELVKETNALVNMTGSFEGKVTGRSGRGLLQFEGQQAVLRIHLIAGGLEASIPKKQTTLVLSSSSNPSDFGQLVQWTASVAADATGLVAFYIDYVQPPFATITLVNGIAVSPTKSDLTTGDHTILALYGGDNLYLPANNFLTQHVNGIPPPTVQLNSSANPQFLGSEVVFSADVTGVLNIPPAPPITGLVQFYIDNAFFHNANLGTTQVSANTYRATAQGTTSLPIGFHTVQAFYRGDTNYGQQSSQPFQQRIISVPPPTPIQIFSFENPSNVADDIYWTVVCTGSGFTNRVLFYIDDVLFSVVPIGSGGFAQSATAVGNSLQIGHHQIIGYYEGDLNHAAAYATLDQNVTNLLPVEVFIHCSAPDNTAIHGDQNVFFYATVTGVNNIPPAPNITGVVDFISPVGVWQSITLTFSGGNTWHAITPPVGDDWPDFFFLGVNQVTAKYRGDSNYGNGVDSLDFNVIALELPRPSIDSSQEPIGWGNPVNWICDLASPDAIPPAPDFDGNVYWKVDVNPSYQVMPILYDAVHDVWTTGGTIATSTLLPGEHVVTVHYRDDSYPERNGATTDFTQHILPIETSYNMSNLATSGVSGGTLLQDFGLNRNDGPDVVSRTPISIFAQNTASWFVDLGVGGQYSGPCGVTWSAGSWIPADPGNTPVTATMQLAMENIPTPIHGVACLVQFQVNLDILDDVMGVYADRITGPYDTGGYYINYVAQVTLTP